MGPKCIAEFTVMSAASAHPQSRILSADISRLIVALGRAPRRHRIERGMRAEDAMPLAMSGVKEQSNLRLLLVVRVPPRVLMTPPVRHVASMFGNRLTTPSNCSRTYHERGSRSSDPRVRGPKMVRGRLLGTLASRNMMLRREKCTSAPDRDPARRRHANRAWYPRPGSTGDGWDLPCETH